MRFRPVTTEPEHHTRSLSGTYTLDLRSKVRWRRTEEVVSAFLDNIIQDMEDDPTVPASYTFKRSTNQRYLHAVGINSSNPSHDVIVQLVFGEPSPAGRTVDQLVIHHLPWSCTDRGVEKEAEEFVCSVVSQLAHALRVPDPTTDPDQSETKCAR